MIEIKFVSNGSLAKFGRFYAFIPYVPPVQVPLTATISGVYGQELQFDMPV